MSFGVSLKHRSQYAGNVIEAGEILVYNSQSGLYFLMTSNVINTVDASMAVSTVALPTPAASSIATETREVNNRTRTDSWCVRM